MISISRILLPLGLVAALSTPAFGAPGAVDAMHNAVSSTEIDLNLSQQNNSGETGQATIKDVSGGIMVKVMMKGEPRGASEPAHIHTGTCSKLDPVPYKPLTNVVDNRSVTTVPGLTVAMLKKGTYAINVHQSAANLKHYVACGNL